ncbi:MAG: ABC-F family ATP-binding cassette domain-containing protein [Prevotellaceae bacterium]|nr:ABC-F family ATP-binding cassette domain-containing protein [Prevotellaceae bacterium]
MPQPVIDIQNVSKRFGERVLFENVSFSIAERQKVGLIARNGRGKSTLLSMIAGKESLDSGEIIFRNGVRVGYLSQESVFDDNETVLDACFNHNNEEEKILKARQILTKLKIADLNQRMGELSGGQQKRVALANVLITEPDLLILDEPTNHLDIEMIEWLEGFLSRGSQALLMVTHDRFFLDRICSIIIELDDHQIYTYRGNYSYYLEKRQERLENRQAELERCRNLYRTELEWMRRMPQARGHKAKYREDAFWELKDKVSHRLEERQLKLKLYNVYIGSKIFESQYVSKAFDEKTILKDFYYNFARYEKMGIVGKNGTGKSTFIKLLLGLVQPDEGRFVIGETVKFGYFSQEGLKFDDQQKVIDVIKGIAEYIDVGKGKHMSASQFLQYFLFSPEQQYDYVYKLSGGEKRKLYLCTVLMKHPNFLILDEPTNDLDIDTLQVLEEYLEDFPGCVIVVSHDRYFTDKIVDHLLVFHGEGDIQDFPGNYTQYREYQRLQPKEQVEAAKPQVREKPHTEKHKLSYKEKVEYEKLEKDIEALESEQKQIEQVLSSPDVPVDKIVELSKRLPILKDELDEKSMRWLELAEFAS